MGTPRGCRRRRRPRAARAARCRAKITRSHQFASGRNASGDGTRRRTPNDQRQQDDQQGQVETTEKCAYHCGKAANVAPPAVSSHTSLPSQKGPMDRMAMRLSVSDRPNKGNQDANPEVKPFEEEIAKPQDDDEGKPEAVETVPGWSCHDRSFNTPSREIARGSGRLPVPAPRRKSGQRLPF